MSLTTPSNREFRIRIAQKKIGDLNIAEWLVRLRFFECLFMKGEKGLLELLTDWFRFSRSMLALSVTVFWKVKWGKSATGLIQVTLTAIYLLNFNSEKIYAVFTMISTWFVSPFLLFIYDREQLYNRCFEAIYSEIFLYYIFAFAVLSSGHVLLLYVGYANKSSSKRGSSWLYMLISRFIKINEFTVTLIEIALTVFIAYCCWHYWKEPRLAIHLWLACLSWLSMEILDESQFAKHKSMMNM